MTIINKEWEPFIITKEIIKDKNARHIIIPISFKPEKLLILINVYAPANGPSQRKYQKTMLVSP